jgi:hypothetical protein
MYVKPGSDTYLTLCFRYEFVWNQIMLFALILKVITSICNETIFHLIMKSTLAKLCGVEIVYLIFLLTEMKCHGGMFSYFYCLTVWELWYFKAYQLSWRAFSSSYSHYNCYSPDGEYKVDLTCHPKFSLAFEEITLAFEVDGPSAHHQ